MLENDLKVLWALQSGKSFNSTELSVYASVIILFGHQCQEVMLTGEIRAGPHATSSKPLSWGPVVNSLSHTETPVHTLAQLAQLLLFSSELCVTRWPEPSPLTCAAKRWSVINFVLPGQTLQHFPSTFWGYLQGYCSGQWIFLHSCLVMLQVHNTHSTIPKARRLGCQDSPCEYVLPFETQTTKQQEVQS